MLLKRWTLLSLIILFSAIRGLNAQDRAALNKIASPESDDEKSYYELNTERLLSPELKAGDRFSFETEIGQFTEFILTKKTSYLPGTISFIAREVGASQNSFSFTYSNGRVNGQYHRTHDEVYALRFSPEKEKNYISSKKEVAQKRLSCGLTEKGHAPVAIPRSPSTQNNHRAKGSTSYTYSSAPLYASVDDSITIDVMIVYTNAAEVWANTSTFGDIETVIAQSLSLSQTALDNSLAGIELRLAHAYKTSYDEVNDGVESDVRLRRLTQNPNNPVFDSSEGHDGYMEEIHDLRNEYGADVVSMIARIDDTGGLGWRLGSSGGNPAFAFNVNRIQQIADSYTLIHEIGHNMGNAHSRTQNESASDDSGGLFHYSAGYQDQANNFHTVMAYSDGLSEAPIFSSPNLQWQGQPTGTNNVQRPENNAKSMRIIKRTVASYQPSVVDAPVADISTNSITVEMNREDELSVPIDISNTGLSALMWSADFDFTSQTVAKKTRPANTKTIQPVILEGQTRAPANFSGTPTRNKSKLAESVLYSTSFENADGFFSGTFKGRASWHSLNETDFTISGENPKSGSNHLRLSYDGTTTKFIASPFFGYQLFGSYEITLSFSVSDVSETYDFYIKDGKTGDFSAAVIIAQQTIFVVDKDEMGEMGFFSTSATVTPNVYRTLKIVYNPENKTIDYYYAGSLIAQNSYINGFTPGVIQVLHRNGVSGSFMDVDDLEVKRISSPYEWLEVPQMTGVSLEQETQSLTLDFNTYGIDAGTYETLLKVKTNDPLNPEFEVPITLSVNDVVPNEIEDIPEQISLDQNYPNPFNPTTTIAYTLNEAQEVRLDIFNIQGQKVGTLQDGKMAAGKHSVNLDASNFSSGVYIYRLQTAGQTLTRQMVLIK